VALPHDNSNKNTYFKC